MTRLYFEPIAVQCDGERPHTFTWRGKLHRVTTILRRWVVQVEWWRQEIVRQYYKVECENLGTYEIYCEHDRWFLERLYD